MKKKVAFDIATKKENFFETWDVIERNLGKSPVYKMPSTFDLSSEVGPSWKHGTLQQFLEKFLALTQDPEDLVEMERLLYLPGKDLKDSIVNSLQKKKTSKEMHMNIHIGDYEVDLVILDLGSDVNILTKKTW